MASSSQEYTPQLGNVVRLKVRDWIVLLHTRDLHSQDVREGPWRVVAEAAVPTTGKVGFKLRSEVDVGVTHVVHKEDVLRVDAEKCRLPLEEKVARARTL